MSRIPFYDPRRRRPRTGLKYARFSKRQLLFGVAGALLAYLSFATAVGSAFASASPLLARNVGVATDQRAGLNLLVRQVAAGQRALNDPVLARAAKAAFAEEPLNIDTLEILALHELERRNADRANRIAVLSNRLSRRETGIAIVLFRQAAIEGNLREALGHIDIALRSAGNESSAIFGALVPVIRSGEMRDAMVPVLDRDEDWVEPFLIYVVDEGRAAPQVAEIFVRLRAETRRKLTERLVGRTITQLVDGNRLDMAKAMLRATPGQDLAVLSDPDISARTTAPVLGKFAWEEIESPTITVHLTQLPDSDKRAATIVVGPGDEALAMARVLMVPPGSYRFAVSSRNERGSGEVKAHWTLSCLGPSGSRPIWSSRQSAAVAVPAGCGAQMLRLFVSQPNSEAHGELTLANVTLQRQ